VQQTAAKLTPGELGVQVMQQLVTEQVWLVWADVGGSVLPVMGRGGGCHRQLPAGELGVEVVQQLVTEQVWLV
jgi:hypothetical protein